MIMDCPLGGNTVVCLHDQDLDIIMSDTQQQFWNCVWKQTDAGSFVLSYSANTNQGISKKY